MLNYFILIVALEHGLILLNMFLELAIVDVPLDAVEGARNAADLIEQYETNPNANLFKKKNWGSDTRQARAIVYPMLGIDGKAAEANFDIIDSETDHDDVNREGLLHNLVSKGDAVPIAPFQHWMSRI